MKKVIKQHDITDCGAACLASIAAHYRLKLPIARIRQYASTDKKGTNVLGMIEAANKIGFSAKGVKGPFESLKEIPKPAIAHVIVKEVLHHFVVIYEVTDKYIQVMDPGTGTMEKRSHEQFKKEWTGILILLAPNEDFQAGNEKISTKRRFWHLIKPHKTVMSQALFGAVVYTLLGLSTSIYVQKIVDYVLVDGNRNLLNLLSTIMLVLLVVQIFIGLSKSMFTLRTGQKIDAQLILGYYKHLLKLPQQFFDTMRVGEIISRVNDAVKIRAFINDVSINLIVNIFIVFFSFGVMFMYYWKLALVMLLIVPFYVGIYWVTNKVNKKNQRKVMENAADLESQLVESLNSVGTIKRFGLEHFANMKTEGRFIKLLQTVFVSGKTAVFSANSTEFVSRVFTIVLLWVGAGFVIDQSITPGELLSFYALIGYLTGPVIALIGMNVTIQDAMIASDRLFELMDLEREDVTNKIELKKDMIGDIVFADVSFRYGSRKKVFEGLNLTLPQGKVSAIVGESGSGKTTLMSLLQNIYKINAGNISIGKYDLKYVSNESLRNLVAVVPQEIHLFAGNVVENVAVGETEPDMERVISICTSLGIMEFIEDLPQGFDTYLGENGTSLSGGQKQRMAIARALYKNPEILILDEATSSLDSASERYIQSAIDLMKQRGKTIIIIAHRLSTICNADKICVMQQGQLIEEGAHKELIMQKGNYYDLWSKQFPILNDKKLLEFF